LRRTLFTVPASARGLTRRCVAGSGGGGGGGGAGGGTGGGGFFSAFGGETKGVPGKLVISDAVFRNSKAEVEARFKGDTGEMDADRNTPVHWAAVKGHNELLLW